MPMFALLPGRQCFLRQLSRSSMRATPAGRFSTVPAEFERAPMYPLADNGHLRPKNVPPVPKKFEDCSWTWITGINSAILRPAGWHANESTITYPWDELTGNPLRIYYVCPENPKAKGFVESGLTISAYCFDRQQGQMTEMVKQNKTHTAVDTLLAPIRFSNGEPIEPGQLPKLNPDIKILKRRSRSPNMKDRFPHTSTRISYLHSNFVPDGVLGTKPKDTRFELEWIASDETGWVYEVVFQAPDDKFDEHWKTYGKMMMNTDKGLHLQWRWSHRATSWPRYGNKPLNLKPWLQPFAQIFNF